MRISAEETEVDQKTLHLSMKTVLSDNDGARYTEQWKKGYRTICECLKRASGR